MGKNKRIDESSQSTNSSDNLSDSSSLFKKRKIDSEKAIKKKVNDLCVQIINGTDSKSILAQLTKNDPCLNYVETIMGTLLHSAAETNNVELCDGLVKLGANINLLDRYGSTPLMIASAFFKFNRSAIQFLLTNGADPKLGDLEKLKKITTVLFPLHEATKEGDYEIAKLLIEKGANVNFKESSSGKSPLHCVYNTAKQLSSAEKIKLVELLLENGAEINSQDAMGFTTTHWAVMDNDVDLVKVLCKHNPDLTIMNDNKRTPLDYVKLVVNPEMESILNEALHNSSKLKLR